MGSILMRFPGGKGKVLTLSYDDGTVQDIRLIGIMQKHGLKGTFNINSGLYAPEGPEKTGRRLTKQQAVELYRGSGMEVAVHGLTHPHLDQLPPAVCTYEVLQDRLNLEADFGFIVRGMAYPFGIQADSDVADILKQCGIVYARTVASTENFAIPEDWLRLPPTCHHANPRLMELAKNFVEWNCPGRKAAMFYVWGHSYEFDDADNWYVIEEFAKCVGGREDIWYATNIEIFDYITAYKQLVFSADGRAVHNPTNTMLYFETRSDGVIHGVKAGETVRFER